MSTSEEKIITHSYTLIKTKIRVLVEVKCLLLRVLDKKSFFQKHLTP